MMQKWLLIFSALIGAGSFFNFSLAVAADNAATTKKISIVATIFPPFDFARQVAGDHAQVTMLLPPGTESHSFEPTPQDIIKIQNCDLFIYVGGESDDWVKKILSSINNPKMKTIALIECVERVEEELVEGMQAEEEEEVSEESEKEYDEHVWTSPLNAIVIVKKITETLKEIDSANAENYQENAEFETKKLTELDEQFREIVTDGNRETIVFGDRFPFRYFADAYGLRYFAAFPGCAHETEASAATVKFLIDKIREEKIPVVFHIELGNEKMAKIIGEETGAKVLLLHACHNVSKSDFVAGKTYIDLMTKNLAVLRAALD